jgi:hypothetical protein
MANPKRPKDTNQRARLIVDILTGEKPNEKHRNGMTVERARKAGLVGGKARAESLTAEQRKEIAKKAANKRWGKK